MKRARKVVGIISIITFAAAMIHMFHGIHVLLDPQILTGFHWTAACAFTAIFFGPILAVELVIIVVLTILLHRKKNS